MFFLPKQTRQRYDANLSRDLSTVLDRDGMINGQGRRGLASMAFGRSVVGHAGCEAIAVFNALTALGRPRPLAEIIRDMEKGGYMRMWGFWGATPWFAPLLRRYGAVAKPVAPAVLQRDTDCRTVTPGAVYIMSVWNRKLQPHKGLHTFTAVYAPGEDGDWTVYNRFNLDDHGRRFAALRDILIPGKTAGAYLVIYRIYPMDI